MDAKTISWCPTVSADMRTAVLRWYQMSNEIMSQGLKIGQPLMDAYIQGLTKAIPELKKVARRSCEIPETECPPSCVCELDWEACEGETVTGTVDIRNTGQQSANFTLSATTFRSLGDDSGKSPQLTPNNFVLAPGAIQTVTVVVQASEAFDPNQIYESEVTVAGRYEQCVCLRLRTRRKNVPHCQIEHGEIPTRLVAHHWYDHFQCEELCFQPVRRIVQPEREKPMPVRPAGTATPSKTKVDTKRKGESISQEK